MAGPHRITRAAVVAALVTVGALVATAPRASAHGVLRSSDPADRAVLDQAPAAVTLSFTEAPEPQLSSVRVSDATGASFGAADAQAVAGDPETLRLPLRPLAQGVYTVSWRIVSRVDGHLTAGTLVFGVQAPVTSDSTRTPDAVAPSPNRGIGAVGGRALLYGGVALLLGAAWTGVALFGDDRRRRLIALAATGWAAAAAGAVALGLAQRAAAGVGTDVFLGTRLGQALLWRGAGLAVAGVGLAMARRRPQAGLALAATGTLGVVVAHVGAGHAAAGSWPGAMVGLQVAHVVAMAAWLGGLAALLVGLGRRVAGNEEAGDDEAGAARRFSRVAAVALGVLVVTGVIRAIDAVGGWSPLVDSDYGRLVLVKSGLLLVLAGLGARNRRRHVPAAGRTLTGLRRVGTTELGVAMAAFVITGLLATSAPPAAAGGPGSEAVLTASDFGTTVKARLTVSPARAGDNRFTLRLADYDTGRPVVADRVTVRFALAAFPGTAPSTLELTATGPGVLAASGTNLSLPGRWNVVVTVERGAGSVELAFDLLTDSPPPPTTSARTPGQPTVVTVGLGGGRSLQVYADPDHAGPTALHLTFFAAGGTEEAVDAAVVTAGGADPATPRRLGPGHFVADVTAPGGRWPVEVAALTATGDYLFAPLDVETSP